MCVYMYVYIYIYIHRVVCYYRGPESRGGSRTTPKFFPDSERHTVLATALHETCMYTSIHNACIHVSLHGWLAGWLAGRQAGRMDGWMDGWGWRVRTVTLDLASYIAVRYRGTGINQQSQN